MLSVAERRNQGPGHHLAHVEMDILAGLGDDRIEPPDQHVAGDQDSCRAVSTLLIGKRIGKPPKQNIQGALAP